MCRFVTEKWPRTSILVQIKGIPPSPLTSWTSAGKTCAIILSPMPGRIRERSVDDAFPTFLYAFQLVPIALNTIITSRGRVWARRQLYNARPLQPTEINLRRSWTCLARQPSWFSWALEREMGGGVAVKLILLEFDVFKSGAAQQPWIQAFGRRSVKWEKFLHYFCFSHLLGCMFLSAWTTLCYITCSWDFFFQLSDRRS